MIVWRYQKWDGAGFVGPYLGSLFSEADVMRWEHNDRDHPGWHADFGKWQEGYLFGCESRAKLLEWFKGWNEKLTREGFYVAVYTVKREHVQIGKSGKQVVFKIDEAYELTRPPDSV